MWGRGGERVFTFNSRCSLIVGLLTSCLCIVSVISLFRKTGNSWVVQWLRLCTSTAGGVGSFPAWGTTDIPHVAQPKKKERKGMNQEVKPKISVKPPFLGKLCRPPACLQTLAGLCLALLITPHLAPQVPGSLHHQTGRVCCEVCLQETAAWVPGPGKWTDEGPGFEWGRLAGLFLEKPMARQLEQDPDPGRATDARCL